jgi:hypothetical protein
MNMKPPDPCSTIVRLLTLRRGERCIYYTGHLVQDICASELKPDPATKYAALLTEIQKTAAMLEETGHVRLRESNVTRIFQVKGSEYDPRGMIHHRVSVTEYVAEGL